MAVVAISQLLILFVAVASANINAKTKYYFPLGEPVQHGIHYNEFSNGQYAHQLASGSSDDKSHFDMLKDNPSDLGSNPAEDFQNWLKMKANEYYSEGVMVSGVDGFAETPLGNISQTCYEDVMKFFVDLDAFKPYALKMQSSWGQNTDFSKAFWTGTAKSYGQYELCVDVTKGTDGSPWDAQYCGLQYPRVTLDLFQAVIRAYIGSCWPSSCTSKDLEIAHRTHLGPTLGEIAEISYDCLTDIPWSGGAIATMCLLAFFAFFVLVGSVYHVTGHTSVTYAIESLQPGVLKGLDNETYDDTEKKQAADDSEKGAKLVDESSHEAGVEAATTESNGITQLVIQDEREGEEDKKTNSTRGGLEFIDRLLMSFSVFQNTEKIFSTEAPTSTLGALNGIRVLSMWWVILGHSFSFLNGLRYDNNVYLLDILNNTTFFAVLYGTFSVDTFFVLSGLLVTYLTLKQLAKTNGKMNWALFYFHRFWRITPTYMVVYAVWATLAIHMGKGAGKIEFLEDVQEKCQQYWWTYLLYINNLYPFPGNISFETCTGHTWYLANDMQFFIVSPIIIYLLYRYSKWGLGLIASMCLVSFGSTAYICWYWGLGAGATGLYNNRTEVDQSVNADDDFIYAKPYCRIPAYLVGMVLGYGLYKLKGKQIKINVFLNLFGWAVAIAVGCSTMYGLKATYNGPQTPQWLAIAYNVLSRFAWSLCVAWVIFVCVTGNAGYINRFLSWSVWSPLARLSFSAYLIHPIVIYLVILTMKTSFHGTYITLSYFFISNTVASYACAYILSLLVEGPTVGLEKVLLGKVKSSLNKKDK